MKILALATAVMMSINVFWYKDNTTNLAEQCNLTEEEFIFLSSVVEAESDRSPSLDGRVLIALTILNRVCDDRFPDTITGVLTQRGQFSTVRNGHSIVERTEYSDQAVLQAFEEIGNETAPNVLFFNCRGYNGYTPYAYVDGNYFMTA